METLRIIDGWYGIGFAFAAYLAVLLVVSFFVAEMFVKKYWQIRTLWKRKGGDRKELTAAEAEEYSIPDWTIEVQNRGTVLGYAEWVRHKQDIAQAR